VYDVITGNNIIDFLLGAEIPQRSENPSQDYRLILFTWRNALRLVTLPSPWL